MVGCVLAMAVIISGKTTIVSVIMFVLISTILIINPSFVCGESDYNFQLEESIQGFRSITDVIYSPNMDDVAVLSVDTIVLYNLSNNTRYCERTFDGSRILGGCWFDDKIYLIMTKYYNVECYPITILSAINLSVHSGLSPKEDVFTQFEPSHDGSYFAASSKKDIFVINTHNLEIIYHNSESRYYIKYISWSHDGDVIATINTGDQLIIHNIPLNQTKLIAVSEVNSVGLFWSLDDNYVYNFNNINGTVNYIDLKKNIMIWSKHLPQDVTAVDLVIERDLLLMSSGPDVHILNFTSFENWGSLNDAADKVIHVNFLQNDYAIYTASYDGTFRIYKDINSPFYNKPPTIMIEQPTEGQIIVGGNLLASGLISDDSGILYSSYRLNRGPWNLFDNFTHWEVLIYGNNMINGANYLEIKASDGEKESLASVSFTYSTQTPNERPTVRIIVPINDTKVRGMMTIEGDASDDVLVGSVDIRIGNGNWIRAIGTDSWYYYADMTEHENGIVTIEARSSDDLLDSIVYTISVIVDNSISPDNERPLVTIIKPLENEEVINNLKCTGTTEDDQLNPRTYYRINGGYWHFISESTEWGHLINVTEETNGQHLISFVAFDDELRSAIVTVEFNKIEYQPMNVIIEHPPPSQEFFSNLRLSGIVTGGWHVQKVEIRVDSGRWFQADGIIAWSFDYNAENTPYGDVFFEFRARDDFGHSDIVSVKTNHTISDDKYIPPQVIISNPKYGDVIIGNLVVSGTVLKGIFEVQQVEIRLDSNEWIVLNETTNWTFSYSRRLLEPGDITIEVRAYDGHSYTTPENVSVTIDDTTLTATENSFYIILIIMIFIIIIAYSMIHFKRKDSIK